MAVLILMGICVGPIFLGVVSVSLSRLECIMMDRYKESNGHDVIDKLEEKLRYLDLGWPDEWVASDDPVSDGCVDFE